MRRFRNKGQLSIEAERCVFSIGKIKKINKILIIIFMKKVLNLALIISVAFLMTSCYSLSYSVGKGAQTGEKISGKNHYLINGLVPLGTTPPVQLATDAKDYDVNVKMTFIDLLLGCVTGCIYTPTTTTVTK
jgi:hypothetical protein